MKNLKFNNLQHKIQAREKNLEIYRKLTGLDSLPSDKTYWTLSHKQGNEDGEEIVQLEKNGFLTKNQFHGVDREKDIIEQNKIYHPNANWHHGNWIKVIKNQNEIFSTAGLIYFDSLTGSNSFKVD